MRNSFKKAVIGSALSLLAATAPAAALSLGVLPAQPVEGTTFTLVASVNAACPVAASIVVTPRSTGGEVQVVLVEACSTPAQPRLVSIPLGPLIAGPWAFHARFGAAQAELQAPVLRVPYQIELDPPFPQEGSPFTVFFSGSGSCSVLHAPVRDGNLLTLVFEDGCYILPPPPAPFLHDEPVGPLPAGDYVMQISGLGGQSIAALRFHVFGAAECMPSDTVLCLQRGRFRVSATWRTASAQGVAKVRPETADSGSLWFFLPDNLELLVKVLDACQNPDPKYWVFAAGLTNVAVDLTVTDTATQTTRHYRNALGAPFAPVLDTLAFACAPPNV
jgi:hypothetical protein